MTDPLAEIVALLRPSAPFSKLLSGAGRWIIRREEIGKLFYIVVLDGVSRLVVGDHSSVMLEKGDFVLIPGAFNFSVSSLEPPEGTEGRSHTKLPSGEIRHGDVDAPPDVLMLVGSCEFASPDAALLVSLLPHLVHVRDEPRFLVLVELVREETRQERAAREFVLSRLLEVLLIEALRFAEGSEASQGLVSGLTDERLGAALRRMHESPAAPWTLGQMAQEAALSRSAFFERFKRAVGVSPMEYLMSWRMVLAKDLLRRTNLTVGEVADRVGYRSQSTFSTAFARQVGTQPRLYARKARSNSEII